MIEFRDHEKQFKTKEYSKKGLMAPGGKGEYHSSQNEGFSGSDEEGSEDEGGGGGNVEYNDEGDDNDNEIVEDRKNNAEENLKNQQEWENQTKKELLWVDNFSKEKLTSMINKLEEEKRVMQGKKNMGSITAKKNN